MTQAFILILVGATSLGTFLLGVKGFGLPVSRLRQAMAKICEALGLMVVFAVVNLAAAMLAVLTVRWLTGWFVSLYIAADMTLLLLAALQALVFQAWRETSHRLQPARDP
jgi:hypothetical protein